MTPDREKRLRELSMLIAIEKNQATRTALSAELRSLLQQSRADTKAEGHDPQVIFREPSQRQFRIIELVAQGLKNREIADHLGISQKVVKNYLGDIFERTGMTNRLELALWYTARSQGRQWKRR